MEPNLKRIAYTLVKNNKFLPDDAKILKKNYTILLEYIEDMEKNNDILRYNNNQLTQKLFELESKNVGKTITDTIYITKKQDINEKIQELKNKNSELNERLNLLRYKLSKYEMERDYEKRQEIDTDVGLWLWL